MLAVPADVVEQTPEEFWHSLAVAKASEAAAQASLERLMKEGPRGHRVVIRGPAQARVFAA
jgi:hypothetical protein